MRSKFEYKPGPWIALAPEIEETLRRIATHGCIYRSDFEEGDCLNNKHESPCPTCLARAILIKLEEYNDSRDKPI